MIDCLPCSTIIGIAYLAFACGSIFALAATSFFPR